MPKPKVRYFCYLNSDDLNRLKKLARIKDVSTAELIRQSISKFIKGEKRNERKPGQ